DPGPGRVRGVRLARGARRPRPAIAVSSGRGRPVAAPGDAERPAVEVITARARPRKLAAVLRRVDLTGPGRPDLRAVLPRARVDVVSAVAAVAPVVEQVAMHGYPAVRAETLRFDGVDV